MATNSTSKHITEIIGFLNESAEYALLRNYEELPDSNRSRDIDIIISEQSFKAIQHTLVQQIDRSGWKIVAYLNSDRLVTLVCGNQDGDNTELVQWDFFRNTSVFGIMLMDADEFLAHRQFNGFLYHVDAAGAFLDKYLYNRAVGALYPAKYQALRQQVATSEFVRTKLSETFGTPSLDECDHKSGKQLLIHALLQNLSRHPVDTVRRMIYFGYTFLRNYICSDTGFSIGFTGPDGVGKTTIIRLLLERLSPVFAKAHQYYHFRPELFGNMGDVAQRAGFKKEVDRAYEAPHRGQKTGTLNSMMRLLYYSTDYLLGYFLKVKAATRITRLVLFDRYYTDIICDSHRSRIFLSTKFLYHWGQIFIPSLDYNILLTAEPSTILRRKGELDSLKIEAIDKRLHYLAAQKGYDLISNDRTEQNAATEILTLIMERQHRKNLKRISQ